MATISNSIQFDIANKQFLIDDLSSGITLANSNANLKIVAPDSTVCYENTNFAKIATETIGNSVSSTTVKLGASAGSTDWTGAKIWIVAGTGAGQTRLITNYNTSTKVATVAAWDITPTASVSTYQVNAADIWIPLDNPQITGTATGGSSTTIVLQGTSTGSYTQYYIEITAGLGAGQKRLITSYVIGTLTATVDTWAINPDSTSVYTLSRPAVIDCPLDSAGEIQAGLYSFTQTVYDGSTYYTLVKTFTYGYTSPTVDITTTIDCFSPLFTMTDSTDYVVESITPSIVRALTIYPPAQLNLASTTGSAATISRSAALYSGINTFDLKSDLIYDYGSGFTIWDYIEDTTATNVTCDYQLCDLYCCVSALRNNYNNAKLTNRVMAQNYLAQLNQVSSIMIQIQQAYQCGKSADVPALVTEVLNVANCTPGCGCSDSTAPAPIIGLGAASQIISVESSTPSVLSVTSTVLGNTTTFFVGLVQSIVTKINNLRNSIVTGSVSNTVTSSTASDGTVTYNVQGPTLASADGSVTIATTGSPVTSFDLSVNPITVLENDFTAENNGATVNTYISLKSFTIAADTLKNNGDELWTKHSFTNASETAGFVKIVLNSVDILPFGLNGSATLILETKIIRISATTVRMWINIKIIKGFMVTSESEILSGVLTVANLTTNTNPFDVQVKSNTASSITYSYQQINKFLI